MTRANSKSMFNYLQAAKLFSKVVISLYISINSVWEVGRRISLLFSNYDQELVPGASGNRNENPGS